MVVKRKTLRRKDKKRRTVSKVRGGYYYEMNNSSYDSKNLFEAIQHRDLNKVKEFLADKSTDVNAKDERGMTALHNAVEVRDLNIAKELLSYNDQYKNNINRGERKKLDIDAFNKFDKTPLCDALINLNHSMIELLIKHGADINIQNKDGRTILMTLLNAVQPRTDIIKLVIRLGAKVDIKDKKDKTAIGYAKNKLWMAVNNDDRNALKNLVNSMEGQVRPRQEGQAGGSRKKRSKTRRLKK